MKTGIKNEKIKRIIASINVIAPIIIVVSKKNPIGNIAMR
jgi:hypothetical protein